MSDARGELGRRLREVVESADDLPDVDLGRVEQLAWSRASESKAPPEETIAGLDLVGMVLAVAAADGDSAAIRGFESRYFPTAEAALRSMGLSSTMQADALAQTREVLFVTRAKDGGKPRILDLVGKGDLSALVKVVAVRRALNLQRGERARPHDSEGALVDVIADQTSPEWGALVGEHRALIKEAFGSAVAELEPESRTLLRLSLLHGLSIDELGAMQNVHRSTAARRLGKIRDTLRARVRTRLQQQLGGSRRELESMLRVAQSGLEISFERLLASGEVGRAPEPQP